MKQKKQKEDSSGKEYSISIQTIKSNPYPFISPETTRDELFKIIYLLEQENFHLKRSFQEVKQKIVSKNPQLSEMSEVEVDEFIRRENQRYLLQKKMMKIYQKEMEEISMRIQHKQSTNLQLKNRIEQSKMQLKNAKNRTKETAEKIIETEKKRTKAIEELIKKKSDEGSSSNLIDRLLQEYHDILRDCMENDKDDNALGNEINRLRAENLANLEQLYTLRNSMKTNEDGIRESL